jgi:hypothetical protein
VSTCRIPAFAFAVDGNGGFPSCTHNCLTKIIERHFARGELEKVFVVQFTLFLLFTNLPPINVPAIH